MSNARRQILLNAFKLFDLVMMVFAFALATIPVLYQSGHVTFAEFLEMRVKVRNFALFSALLVSWHLVFSSFGLYHSRRLASRRSEVVKVIKATSLGTLAVWLAAILFRIALITPLFLLVFWTVSTFSAVMGRFLLRYLLERVRLRGRNLRCMLIVGTNSRAIEFARKIESKPELGYRIIGFADENWGGSEEFKKSGYPLVCNFDNFPTFLRNSVVDEVMIGLPIKSLYFHASRIAAICEEQGVIMRFLSSIFNLRMARSKAEEFEGDSLITLYTGALEGWPVFVKRALDFTASLVLLLILAPLLLLLAGLIKLTSPGPVFFTQKRLGVNKRRFSIHKFRTMIPGAEQKIRELEDLNEVEGPVFKIKGDPRITPIGRFLRKTSLDELPQLFNVLKGEMSLVGPRPLPVRDYEGFSEDWQRRRFSVRPGITCLWQVNGRSSISFAKWMELDMQYIDKWSLWLDLKILARTIPAVLKGSGAA